MKHTLALVLASGLSLAACAEPRLFRSSPERDFRETNGALPSLHSGPGAFVIDLDSAPSTHKFFGVGVSFAEASCHLLMKMPAAERKAVIARVFGKTGAGLSIGRVHCGSSDYSRRFYTYDDVADDVKLEHFSIDPDRAEVMPVIREAMAENPDLFLFSSTWSPPGWMKTPDNATLCGGHLREDRIPVYADYLVRFFRAYGEAGLPIRAFTVQNEPQAYQMYNSPTCLVPAETEAKVIDAVVPRLRAAKLDVKPWLFDHNFSFTSRVEKCLSDPKLRAQIGAVAWHPYGCRPELMRYLHERHPDLPMHVTEMGPHIEKLKRDVLWWGDLVLSSFNCGCSSFTSWCLALDEDGQPNVSLGFPCAGFVEIHSETGAVSESQQCRLFRHLGPFVQRGADILTTAIVPGPGLDREAALKIVQDVVHTVFRNPDGSHVAVFVCKPGLFGRHGRQQVQLKCRGQYLPVQLFAGAVVSVVWPAERNGKVGSEK